MNDELRLRHFTVEQANATLPLVQRVVGDLLDLHPRWRAAVTAYELLQDGATADGESEEARAARVEAGYLAGEIEGCLDELEQIGCIFKGFEAGLVDFAAELRVASCCSAGGTVNTRIEYWHEFDGGFEGRRPLDPPSSRSPRHEQRLVLPALPRLRRLDRRRTSPPWSPASR